MANTTVAQAVLFNRDLLDIICLHTDRHVITSLRLCCRTLKGAAAPHLFRRLVLSARKRHTRRLQRVAACEKFANGVREIVWETAHYGGDIDNENQEIFIKAFLLLGDATELEATTSSEQQRVWMARFKNLKAHEKGVWTDKDLTIGMIEAFRKLVGLRSVVSTVWDAQEHGHKRFLVP